MMRTLGILLAAVLGGAVPGLAGAQDRVIVIPESGTPVIATEILVAAGPANEPEDREGVAYLAARSVTGPVLPVLDSLGAHLALHVQKDALSLTLVAAPDAWEEASRVLMVALFRDPPAAATIQRERAAIRAELTGRRANPADALTRAADLAFFGEAHPWSRPAAGTIESIERITTRDVDAFLRGYVRSDRALAIVVGPIDEGRARRHLGAFIRGAGRLPTDAPPAAPAGEPTYVDYNSITTWVAASYPFSPAADEEALRLAAHLVLRSLTSGVNRHLVYNASAEVHPRAGGGEIRFQLVTPPEAAERMGERLLGIVQQLHAGRVPPDVWDAQLRRYRGERLQALGSPDARAYEFARRLISTAGEQWLLPDFEELSQDRLARAVGSLGDPAIVFLGPSLDGAGN